MSTELSRTEDHIQAAFDLFDFLNEGELVAGMIPMVGYGKSDIFALLLFLICDSSVAASPDLNRRLEVFASHAAASIAGYELNSDRYPALLFCHPPFESACGDNFGQVPCSSYFGEVDLYLRLFIFAVKPQSIYCSL
jgi:hypothetical protein